MPGLIKILFIISLLPLNIFAQMQYNKGSEIHISEVGTICIYENTFRLNASPEGGLWSGNGITDMVTGDFNPLLAGVGTHIISYTIGDEEESVDASINITVEDVPEISIVRTPYTDCAPTTIVFTNNTEHEDYTYLWKAKMPGSMSNQISNLKTAAFTYSVPGIYTVQLIATTPNRCSDTVKVFVTIQNPPKADFNIIPTKTGLFNPRIEFEDKSTGAMVWEWYFGNGNISNKQHPIHLYSEPGEYEVKLIILSEFLCSDSIIKTVTIVEDHKIYFPTAINVTSYENYEFYPKGVGIDKENYELIIYNRFGEVVFQTRDFNTSWKGKYNSNKGEFVPQGIYSYFCRVRDLNGRFHVYSGHVNVFR